MRPKWLPNALSLSRLFIAAPLVLWYSNQGSWKRVLLWALIGAATDGLDGHLARTWNACTQLGGKVIDPVADSALIGAILYGLIRGGRLPLWLLAVAVLKAIIVNTLCRLSMFPTVSRYANIANFFLAITGGAALILLLAIVAFPGHLVMILAITAITIPIVVSLKWSRIQMALKP